MTLDQFFKIITFIANAAIIFIFAYSDDIESITKFGIMYIVLQMELARRAKQ